MSKTFSYDLTKTEPRLTFLRYAAAVEAESQEEADKILAEAIEDGSVDDLAIEYTGVDDVDLHIPSFRAVAYFKQVVANMGPEERASLSEISSLVNDVCTGGWDLSEI